jgi:hypothetical protein
LEAAKIAFDAPENVDERVSACADILSCLKDEGIRIARARRSMRTRTASKTPTPAKITFAGENTCQINT